MNQNRLSRLHLRAHDQCLVGREVRSAEGSSLREADALVQREDVDGLGHDVLCVSSRVLSGDENALADVQRRHVAADVFDVAGSVAAGDVGKIWKPEIETMFLENFNASIKISLGILENFKNK